MRMYLISDNVDTLTGMRLAGIEGVVCHNRDHLRSELDKVLTDKTIGILLITELLSNQFPDIIEDIKLHRRLPIVVAIPDRHGTGRNPNLIMDYVNEAIGVKVQEDSK